MRPQPQSTSRAASRFALLLRWLTRCGAAASSATKALGNEGERLAAQHLRQLGYRIVARNLFIGDAEADLVCLTPDRRTIVIVEVKARRVDAAAMPAASHARPGRARSPEAAITERKQAKLRQLAGAFARRRRWAGRPVRIDVIAIDFAPTGAPLLRHHPDAVR